ncbi:MAG: GTP 3',8-cyclase MoaA [Bacillota bacterium]
MQDNFHREINYLRVSVTDRCNLRCVYCIPREGVPLLPHAEVLRLEEVERVVRAGVLTGVRKVRFTGGEPLVRKGFTSLVEMIARIPEIDDLAVTTNGILFGTYANELKNAGLKRVNLSLDTLRPERYRRITGGGELAKVLAAMETALESGFHPVKLNTVVVKGFNDDEITALARLSIDRPLHVRFIELMPFGPAKEWGKDASIPTGEVKKRLESEFGTLEAGKKPAGGGPARYYRLPGAAGTVGFISGMSGHICARCNRLRLTAAGKLRPCLFGEHEVDIKGPLRGGAGIEELAGIIRTAIRSKYEEKASGGCANVMARIGG